MDTKDGGTLAAASLSQSGDTLVLRVFDYDGVHAVWRPRGSPIKRYGMSFFSFSLALSNDGQVVALGDWAISSPAVTVQAFEWTGYDWIQRGRNITSLFGPVSVALSRDGRRLALSVRSPGVTQVFQWESEDWVQLGQDMAGGSAVAMDGTGQRIVIGNSLSDNVLVQDYVDEVWSLSSLQNGKSGSLFGFSVSMSQNGTTLAIGAPLDNAGGDSSGRVVVLT